MADTHYYYFLIRKCICAWQGLVAAGKLHLNTREQLINNHDRLTTYLMAMQERPKTFGNEDMKRAENQEEEGTMRKTKGVELKNGSSEKKGIVVRQGMYRNVWSRAREHVVRTCVCVVCMYNTSVKCMYMYVTMYVHMYLCVCVYLCMCMCNLCSYVCMYVCMIRL